MIAKFLTTVLLLHVALSAEIPKNATEVAKKNTTEVAKNNATHVANKNTTEVAKNNATHIANKNTTEVAKKNATEVAKKNTTEVAKKNATAATKKDAKEASSFRAFENVDPNDLSCDPAGHIFLLLPHFTDCSKFYMCAHGEEVEFPCPGGLIFDFPQQTCNWNWATKCWLRTPTDEDEGSGDEADGLIGVFIDDLEHQPVDTVASVRPISPMMGRYNGVINCARADAAARQVPYKGDCQRYWRCVAGVPQVVFCSDGLFFNEYTQQCDFEANSKCVLSQEDELKSEFIKYEQ